MALLCVYRKAFYPYSSSFLYHPFDSRFIYVFFIFIYFNDIRSYTFSADDFVAFAIARRMCEAMHIRISRVCVCLLCKCSFFPLVLPIKTTQNFFYWKLYYSNRDFSALFFAPFYSFCDRQISHRYAAFWTYFRQSILTIHSHVRQWLIPRSTEVQFSNSKKKIRI